MGRAGQLLTARFGSNARRSDYEDGSRGMPSPVIPAANDEHRLVQRYRGGVAPDGLGCDYLGQLGPLLPVITARANVSQRSWLSQPSANFGIVSSCENVVRLSSMPSAVISQGHRGRWAGYVIPRSVLVRWGTVGQRRRTRTAGLVCDTSHEAGGLGSASRKGRRLARINRGVVAPCIGRQPGGLSRVEAIQGIRCDCDRRPRLRDMVSDITGGAVHRRCHALAYHASFRSNAHGFDTGGCCRPTAWVGIRGSDRVESKRLSYRVPLVLNAVGRDTRVPTARPTQLVHLVVKSSESETVAITAKVRQ